MTDRDGLREKESSKTSWWWRWYIYMLSTSYSTSIIIFIYWCIHKFNIRITQLVYIYIYIYIFTNLISTSIHGIEKTKKPWLVTRDKSTSNHRPGEKEKSFLGKKKERASLVRLLENNQGVRIQWSKENQKTLRECCNATITKLLNTIQWSQL